MKTKMFIEEFKGHKIFGIYEVDDFGNKKEANKGPMLSFGAKKASILLSHKDDLEKFVKDNTMAPSPDNGIDMSKLSPEQQAQIAAILGQGK